MASGLLTRANFSSVLSGLFVYAIFSHSMKSIAEW